MAQTKILIIGGSGYIGTNVAQFLAQKHAVTATYRKNFTPVKNVEFFHFSEINEKDHCKALMLKFEPDIVIYAAGSNDVTFAEKDSVATQAIHSNATSIVLTAADYIKAKFIFLSSDYVFSGSEGNYSESDTPMPYSQIGKAKLNAENYIRGRSNNHVIIRSSFLLGRGTLQHPSWFDQLREMNLKKQKIPLPKKTFHNPVHISVLFQVLDKIIQQDIRNKTFHLGGLTKSSLFEVAEAFFKLCEFDEKLLETNDASSSTVPSDYSLNFTQTLRSLKLEPLLLQQSLDMLK